MSRQASSPPPSDRPAPVAPPPPPWWHHLLWLLPLASLGVLFIVLPTRAVIDAEVSRLLREAEKRATTLLKDHRGELQRLAGMLVEQETVDGAAVYRLIGKTKQGDRQAASA